MPTRRDYIPMPYVSPERPRETRSLGDLIRAQGQQRAEMMMRAGEQQAQAYSNIGSGIAQSLQGWQQTMMADRERKQKEAMQAQQMRANELAMKNAEAEMAARDRQVQDQEILGSAMSSSLDPDAIEEQLTKSGYGHIVPQFRKSWDEAETHAANVKKAKMEFEAVESDYFGSLAAGVKPHLGEPDGGMGAATLALAHAKSKGYDVDGLMQRLESPEQLPGLVEELIARSPTQRKLAGEEEERRIKGLGEERQVKALEQTQADRLRDDERATLQMGETSRHNRAMENRPVGAPQPAYQQKQVLNDEGVPVMANYDSRTGRTVGPDGQVIANPRPVPEARETADARKYKQAGPILSSVSELSEKINTQQGLLAKMSGGAAKIAAKANYDDDVAEYQALISGFTPLVARALGHTGVLTQQDVDSVKELFPRPGDSKTLRDRKINRINHIIGELEGTASTTTPMQAPAPQAAARPAASPASFSVRTPDGQTFTFPSQKAADDFKRAAGIK